MNMNWQNIDTKWITLYVYLNKHLCSNIEPVKHLLPSRRKGKRGVEPGLGSYECKRRYLTDEYIRDGKIVKSSWVWPKNEPTKAEIRTLMAIMLELSIGFFFDNFTYCFGGDIYLQGSGGPIGARLTMAISRLVMQQWWDDFSVILPKSGQKFRLKAIYVDDGRMIIQKLKPGMRY